MISKYKTFIINGVVNSGQKPAITMYPDPVKPATYLACFSGIDCDEMINGYTYDELLSIRNTINEVLTDIDVRETVAELNTRDPSRDPYSD
jgi:hypothetical protein